MVTLRTYYIIYEHVHAHAVGWSNEPLRRALVDKMSDDHHPWLLTEILSRDHDGSVLSSHAFVKESSSHTNPRRIPLYMQQDYLENGKHN
jgi:hypothetical protein